MLGSVSSQNALLLVDDEPQVLTALTDLLEDHYEIFSQTSAVKALEVLEREPSIAVVISDQRMPDMTGNEFLAQARLISSATRMMITGFADLGAVVRAINDGQIFAYISKPWDPHHLAIMVHKAIEHYEISRALTEERVLLHDLMAWLPDAVSLKDLQKRFIRINRTQARMMGVEDPESVVGKRLSAFWTPERAAQVEAMENEVIATRQPVIDRIEYVPNTRGEPGWVSRTVVPVRTERDEIISLIGVTRDVTEREQSRQALSDSERRHRLLYNRAPVMMYSTDPWHRLVTVSDLWCATLGYVREDVIGRPASKFMDEASQHRWSSEILPWFLKTGQARDIEIKFACADGRPVDALLSLVAERDEHDDIVQILAVVIDVRAQKALERQLVQAQKMEAVGQLTGGIAHDFNNLLTVVLGNLEMIEDDLAGDDRVTQALGMVQRAALRGSELTHRLLAFSRQQMLEPSDIDMNAAISGLTGMVARTLGEHIDVRTVLNPGLWVARIDPGQLESALLNLCVNARDAMPNGGTLTISTENATLGPDVVRADMQPGDYVVLSVTDTGTGIPPEILERVFEPFFTTKEQGKGTGLGLSMVYGFVSQSGGHLDITSTPGQGTTLKLIFPRSRTAPEATHPLTVVADLPGGSEAILVVEDQPDVRSITIAMLQSLGYQTVVASDADEALGILRGQTVIDLLFTDVVMPGSMSGVDLAQHARAARPDLKVLFCSGYRESAMRGNGDTASADIWIAKPFRRHRLAERVRQALDLT